MKLYLVIMLFGQVSGAIGPLPYSEEECTNRTGTMRHELRFQYEAAERDGSHLLLPLVDGRRPSFSDWAFVCRWANERPAIEIDE